MNTEIVKDVDSLNTRAQQAEHNFLQAEQLRQECGFEKLKELLNSTDPEIIAILGIAEIPPDFCLESGWFQHTGEYLVNPTIVSAEGLPISVVGVRFQNNIVNRNGRAQGVLCPVGGGVRVSFVPGIIQTENSHAPSIVASDVQTQLNRLKQEGAALAAAMVPKIMGLQFTQYLCTILSQMHREDLVQKAQQIILGGGAKADIFIPRLCSTDQSHELELIYQALKSCGYEWAKLGVIGPAIDRMAGDQNTTAQFNGRPIIEGLLDGILIALQEKGATSQELTMARASVTGKGDGGLEARTDATGLGCWESLKSYAFYEKIRLKGKSVFFRGCGSAAKRAIVEACHAGMIVTGVADINAVLHCPDGFTEQDARMLFEVGVNQRGNTADWARAQQLQGRNIQIYTEPGGSDIRAKTEQLAEAVTHYWQEYAPEVIFESAAQGTLNQKTADHVPPAAVIAEGANGATTPLAAAILKRKHVERIPGISCNAGGVFASWFEWAQDILGVSFTTEQVENAIARLANDNMRSTLCLIQLAAQYDIVLSQEEAFYALAIARGLKAKDQFEQTVKS